MTEHAAQVVDNILSSFIRAVDLIDELVEGVLNSIHVDFILLVHSLGDFVGHVAVDVLAGGDEVLLDTGEGVVLSDGQVDELVGDDAHALEGKGLDTGPGETLNDPALSLLLEALDLLLNKVDHDLVVDYLKIQLVMYVTRKERLTELEVVEAGLDAGGVGTASCDVLAEELASRDALPLEVLGEGL